MKSLTYSFIFLILALLTISFLYFSQQFEKFEIEEEKTKFEIEEMERVINFIKNDFENFLEISIPRAFACIISYEIESGNFIDDVINRTNELFFNSTLFSNSSLAILMQNHDFKSYVKRIENALKGYKVNIYASNISLKHYDSFNILIFVNISINLSYALKQMNANFEILKKLNINGYEDVLHAVNSLKYFGSASTNIITKNPYSYFTKKILIGISNGNAVLARSFVSNDRNQIINLQNKKDYILVTNSTRGIESVVNDFKGVVLNYPNTTILTIPYLINSSSTQLVPNNTFIVLYPLKNSVFEVEKLKENLENQYCNPSLYGASFLDRLEGKFEKTNKFVYENPVIGLECFVNKDELIKNCLNDLCYILINQNIKRSNLDYNFFNLNKNVLTFKIAGFENFYLDNELTINNLNHLQYYQVEELIE